MQRRLSELVRTRSTTGDELAAIDLVTSWLEAGPADDVDRWTAAMADLEDDPAYPGREVERDAVPVVAAAVSGAGDGPTTILTGHVDTVAIGDPDRWSQAPLGAVLDGDRLYGRGACDMKAGVVAALAAFEELAQRRNEWRGRLAFVAVPGEEDGGTGTLAAIRRGWTGDNVIITEPTSDGVAPRVVVAHGGALTFSIEVEGRSAHGAVPAEGESALAHFWTVYRAIEAMAAELNTGVAHEVMGTLPLPYPTTIGIVRGGWWASNVMEQLRAEARVGVMVGETVDEAEARFVAGIAAAAAGDPWLRDHPPRITRTGAAFGSSEIQAGHPLVAALEAAAAARLGSPPQRVGVPYGCDMALWRNAGEAAAVVYGPGDVRVAHAADEWVSIAETERVVPVLVDTVLRLHAGGA